MGLWAGVPELLNSAECKALGVGDMVTNLIKSGVGGFLGPYSLAGLTQDNLLKTGTNLRETLGDGLPVLGLPSGLGGSLNPVSTSSSTGIKRTTVRPSLTNFNPLGNLGGFLG